MKIATIGLDVAKRAFRAPGLMHRVKPCCATKCEGRRC